MKRTLYSVIFLTIFFACQKKEKAISTEKVGDNVVTSVCLNSPMDSMVMKLSSFGENVRIVPLETSDSCLFAGGCSYMVGKKYIIAFARTQILLFDSNGKYLRTLSVQGRGPGEFGSILPSSLALSQGEDMLVASDFSYDIVHRWNLPNGEYTRMPTVDNSCVYAMIFVNDTTLLLANNHRHVSANHRVYTQTLSGRLLNGIPNRLSERSEAFDASVDKRLFLSKDRQYYRPPVSDSVYQIFPDTLMLKYVFPLPQDMAGEILYMGEKRILASTRQWLKSIERVSPDGKSRSVRNVYDVRHYVVNILEENVLSFRCLQDDYLGIDNALENIVFQDNQIFYIRYSAPQLIEMFPKILENDDLDPEVRKRVEKLKAEITEDSNPVLIIGEYKQEF